MSPAGKSDDFRDSLATIDSKGKRLWVYPTKPKGRKYRARIIVSYFLLAFLFVAPFLQIQGNPFLRFDILNRRFFIFGAMFWPQDFYLLVLAVITFVVLIFLFTAAFGRLFCGWVCPQTIFLEMVFRRIEFLIEGGGARQRMLDQAPMSGSKFVRKALKHGLFLIISFLVVNILLAYVIGPYEVLHIASEPPWEHTVGFLFMAVFSLAFYGTYARFREQVCTLVCPYGRLQSVMLDSNSIVVSYDFRRGEPRSRASTETGRQGKGDCIDCGACVKVCPTGIDIRNGTQLECVNCTACIDACDLVMDGVKKPRGLIRYASYRSISEGKRMTFSPRLKVYSGLLLVLITLIVFLLVGRQVAETTILRAAGSLYVEIEDDGIRNLYTVSVVNKTARDLPIELRLKGDIGKLAVVGPTLDLKPQGMSKSVFSVEINRKRLFTTSTPITVEVISNGKVIDEIGTTFVGPEPKKDDDD
jgi:cytochrome c oxidase accessory protein FixG